MTQDNNKSKEKMNFFHRMKIAVKDFELYGILASERLVKSIKYFLILILIYLYSLQFYYSNYISPFMTFIFIKNKHFFVFSTSLIFIYYNYKNRVLEIF